MSILDKYSPYKILLISLISAIFIVYPNIAFLPWELTFLDGPASTTHVWFFVFRYFFFVVLIFILIKVNLEKINTLAIQRRFLYSTSIGVIAYLIYLGTSLSFCSKADCFGSILIFQFFVMCILCSFLGHVSHLYLVQRKKEHEIEQLKIENLKSQLDALASQIDPHFFFNSLNGLSALIRKKNDENTLAYVNKLSDVFRYILQSGKKGLVTLEKEIEFLHSFRYMMEVRFANKLTFNINVDKERMNLKLPVLSLLPLIDNIVTHNTIDSQHKMDVDIYLNEESELVVSNPIYPKLSLPATNGTGLKNLENRFALLMNKQIRVEDDGQKFAVYLPLN
jgi:sensor histidine kinase YesM